MMNGDVLVYGGLGDPNYSVVRLYEELLLTSKAKFSIIAIDPIVRRVSTTEVGSYYQFPYDEQYASLDEYIEHQPVRKISCVFVLTSVSTHLSILKEVSLSFDVSDLLFVVEKPSFSLHEVEEGFSVVVPRLKQQGAKFYFIDTAIVTPAFDYFFSNQSCVSLGLPEKIVAISTDNPVTIHPQLDEFSFENRIAALNSRNLLNLEESGGGGYGFDMGIHAIAGLVRYLQKMQEFDARIDFSEIKTEYLNNKQLKRSIGAETHIYALGSIVTSIGHIELLVDAGKASDIWDRRLELHYAQLTVVIGFGTLKHPPYLWRSDHADSEAVVFNVTDSGYKLHFNDILSALEFDINASLSCEASEEIMCKSMYIMSDLFSGLSTLFDEREKPLIRVDHHSYTMAMKEQLIRERLTNFTDSIALNIHK
ncbi:hypothetical protein [Vibrio ziniensis]|uniref:Gfo/Idh/MocA-like oxidoreductase N-terminal domain-containing protein n=1 Tax=Vibrio ziniensis TaxID=2711221 RepID=A0A6G7CQL6_9VIBR|nr:hypothetical protein [Vibrio ziniensis]QIH44336.1 hypothetical protein G5S32_20530 [Vibrio ziniensis]